MVLTQWGKKMALVGWGALMNWVIIKHPTRYNYNPHPPLYLPKGMILYEEEKTLHVVLTQWRNKEALVG